MVGVDIVAASFGHSFKLDTCVFVGPDVVVAILGTLFDTGNLDVFGRTIARR